MLIKAINAGYYQYKCEDYMFKSRLSKNVYGSLQGNVDVLQFCGEQYIVGAGRINLNMDKSNNEFMRILVLNMLGKYTDEKEVFRIVLSTPPLVYGRQKELLPEYIEGEYEIVQNGKKKNVCIDKVKVYPETIAAYIANQDRFKGRSVILIDIGGLTSNVIRIRNGNFTNEDIVTIEHGMYHLDFKISQYLKSKYNELHCNPDDVQYFRDVKSEIMNDEVILDFYKEHIDEIVEVMDYKNFDYASEDYEVMILGGGGLILIDVIRGFFLPEAVLSNDPIKDNWVGLDILARKVFRV